MSRQSHPPRFYYRKNIWRRAQIVNLYWSITVLCYWAYYYYYFIFIIFLLLIIKYSEDGKWNNIEYQIIKLLIIYMRFEVLAAVKMSLVIWVLLDSSPEDGGNMLLRNVCTHLQVYTASKPRRSPWISSLSDFLHSLFLRPTYYPQHFVE
jgi:hypothetical protein